MTAGPESGWVWVALSDHICLVTLLLIYLLHLYDFILPIASLQRS